MRIDLVPKASTKRAPWHERYRIVLIVVVPILFAIALFFVFTRTPEPTATFSDTSQPVQVKVGDIFAVTVSSTAENEPGWGNIPIGMDDPFLVPIATGCDSSKSQCRFVFRAAAPGQKNLTLTWGNTQTGLRGTPPEKTTYQYQINIAP